MIFRTIVLTAFLIAFWPSLGGASESISILYADRWKSDYFDLSTGALDKGVLSKDRPQDAERETQYPSTEALRPVLGPSGPTRGRVGEHSLRSTETKSPRKAFLLSIIVPGAGELYSGATKRGIGFLGGEIAFWTIYALLNGKGGDLEDDFRAFADERWNEEWYREWRTSAYTYGDTTHTLPDKEEDSQQYYEMIGKYDQFVFGWDDRSSDTLSDSTWTVKSENRDAYEDMRDDSNRYLKRAQLTLGVILFNHVVSAIDAARHAKLSGEALEEKVKVRMILKEGRHPILVVYKRF